MSIGHILSFLVPPRRDEDEGADQELVGAAIPPKGRLFDMLAEIYNRSDTDCKIPIRFAIGEDGKQTNAVRSEVVHLIKQPSLKAAQPLAQRLQAATTGKSGMGLLFILCGQDGGRHKVMISRFPADHAILAETHRQGLKVEFIERVFMKNAASYKSAVYSGKSLEGDFWDGLATDRQLNSNTRSLSTYWIKGFLVSDFKTTSKAGSRRLAGLFKEAVKQSPSLEVKQELISAVTMAKALGGKSTTIREFCAKTHLSEQTKQLLFSLVQNPDMLTERFDLDHGVFKDVVRLRWMEVDNGVVVAADIDKFKEAVKVEVVAGRDRVKVTTEGKIVDERIGARR